jgi:hypothetical protein
MVHALELFIDTGIDYVRGRLRIVVDTHTDEGEFIEPRQRLVEIYVEGTDTVAHLTLDQAREMMAALGVCLHELVEHDHSRSATSDLPS